MLLIKFINIIVTLFKCLSFHLSFDNNIYIYCKNIWCILIPIITEYVIKIISKFCCEFVSVQINNDCYSKIFFLLLETII